MRGIVYKAVVSLETRRWESHNMTGIHLANHLAKEKSRLGVEGRDFAYACSRSNEFALVPSIVWEYVQNVP